MRAIFLLLILSLSGSCLAQTTFTLQPSSALATQPVTLRIDDGFGCYPATQIDVERSGNVVDVTAWLTDAGNCQLEFPTPRFVGLGGFSAGTYLVQVTQCSNPPPPLPQCTLQATLPLTVYGVSESTFTVPALSSMAAIGLALVLMTFGALFARRSD